MSLLDTTFPLIYPPAQDRLSGRWYRQKKKSDPAMSPPIKQMVATGIEADLRMHLAALDSLKRVAWRAPIQKLFDWLHDPSQLADDGVDVPSQDVLFRAILFAIDMQNKGNAVPTSIVPDANGGIVFENLENGGAEQIHFWNDDTVEYIAFRGNSVVERRMLRSESD